MCKVIIKNSEKDKEFIIYNHLFSQKKYTFTIEQLIGDLQQYNLSLSYNYVQKEIDDFVKAGLLKCCLKGYSLADK